MMRRRIFGLVGLLLVAVVAGLSVLPARWLGAAIPTHWPLALGNAQGTVWSGSAALAIGPTHSRRRLPDLLHWHWSFSGGPRLHLQHPWLGGPLVLAITPKGLTLSSQTLALPAQTLAALDPRLAAVGPEGHIRLSWPALRLNADRMTAQQNRLLQAEWRDAASALTPIRPLGHYSLALNGTDDAAIQVQLLTLEGPLLLQGSGLLHPGQGLQFDGTAQADPAAHTTVQAALQDVLGAIGPRQNNMSMLRFR